MQVTAVALDERSQFATVALTLPACPEGGALLKVEMTGICGSDSKMWRGEIATPRPLVMGHEVLGHIHQVSRTLAERSGIRQGDRVVVNVNVPCWSCTLCWSGQPQLCKNRTFYGCRRSISDGSGLWGGFAEYMVIEPGSMLHPIKHDVPPRSAVLLGMIANGIDWTGRGGIGSQERVVIQGAGPQGIACAIAAREAGAQSIVMTGLAHDQKRLDLADELAGVTKVVIADDCDFESQIRDALGGELADCVIDVTGAPSAFMNSIAAARIGGRLVLAGLGGDNKEARVVLDDIVRKNLTLHASISKSPASFERATTLVERGRYELERLVTHTWGLDQVHAALKSLEGTAEDRPIKSVVVPARGNVA